MLVLTRKKNESIIIGNNIEIKILKMGKNSVEVGISAPNSYSIFRKEVFDEVQKKNVEAIKSVELGDISNIKNLFDEIKKTKENTVKKNKKYSDKKSTEK